MSAPTADLNRISHTVHAVPEVAVAYVAGMSISERKLHEMSIEILGSSYFVESSHGFRKWEAKQKS